MIQVRLRFTFSHLADAVIQSDLQKKETIMVQCDNVSAAINTVIVLGGWI